MAEQKQEELYIYIYIYILVKKPKIFFITILLQIILHFPTYVLLFVFFLILLPIDEKP